LAGKPSVGSADGVGDGAQFASPAGVAVDGAGNLYIADTGNLTIRRITAAGVVSTIAGFPGSYGSADGMNGAARFNSPGRLALDGAGNLYVADTQNYTVRKITPSGTNWVVSTIAGQPGRSGSSDGTNSDARFSIPAGIALDIAGNLYVADTGNETIRKIVPTGTNWIVSTLAGSAGQSGGEDGTGTDARFSEPYGVAVDGGGNVYVADKATYIIRRITPAGVVSTIAGLAYHNGSRDGTNDDARFDYVYDIAVDSAGTLYVAEFYNNTIRKVTPIETNWVVSTLAGNASLTNQFNAPIGGYADGTGTNALFNAPQGVGVSSTGDLYVVDTGNSLIRKVTSAGVVSTLSGSVGQGSANGTGGAARFYGPYKTAVDSAGNVYVADSGNHTIRKITSAGLVSTIAGRPTFPGSADGAGSDARFNTPQGVAVDNAGNLYVADTGNMDVRKITPAGVVTTIAGLPGFPGIADGTNEEARFATPSGIAVDGANNVYLADGLRVRRITPIGTNWVVTTIAGSFITGSTDGTGTNALFYFPEAVTVDGQGNVYVADTRNFTIRRITPAGLVSTIAGSAGEQRNFDGIGSVARFFFPTGIAVDSSGDLYVADRFNDTIRKISPIGTNWAVSTIGGLPALGPSPGTSGSADGAGSAALFSEPTGVAVDHAGNLYVADFGNNTIRKGVFTQYTPANPVPYFQPPMDAQLVVTLLPPEASGQWRFPWELGWRNSGQVASNLVAGNYPVEFRSMPGYLAVPPSLTIAVTNGGATPALGQYFPTVSAAGANGGTLTVNIGPSPPSGAGWRFLGDNTPFFSPGYSTNLLPGNYLIEFAPVSGRVKPPNLAVQVFAGQPTVLFENYLLASSPPVGGLLPTPVPPDNISDLADLPFGFNGQLQSDTGYGSGVAVLTNVVLTAAHVIFNDQTLSYVSQAYWYFQREAGVFEPEPLAARGWYVLSGYAAQRTNDLGGLGGQTYFPDQSSAESRNLDVAALYFFSPVAGGGYGGYLPSDESPNPWLTGTSLKMLVGYPVDGSLFGDASIVPGEMYQTDPQPYPLSPATDPVNELQEVYIAPWFLSYPGNSGGPVYAQFNGYFYPAGVYLGTLYNGSSYQSAVRAIDSSVVNLITLAATQGDSGTNNTGGGVITVIPNQNVSANNPGYVQFQLAPPAAVQQGAAWRLQGDSSYSTAASYTRAVISTNAFAVEFKTIPGWNLPTNQSTTILPGVLITNIAFYTVTNPVLVAGQTAGLGITGTTGTTYRLESRNSLSSGSWIPLSTNTIVSYGFNLVLPLLPTNQPATYYRALWLQQ